MTSIGVYNIENEKRIKKNSKTSTQKGEIA